MEAARKYRPRYPVKKNKNAVTIRNTDRAGLAALARYPYLTVKWMAPLFGLTEGSMENRVTDLKHAGYIKVAEYQERKRNYNEPLAYELDTAGETLLADLGIPIDRDEFSGQAAHRLMSCKVRASFELGTTDAFKLYTWPQLISMGKIPEKTLKSKTPHMFELGNVRFRPDTYPFVIDHLTSRIFILGVEVDCGTESIRSYDYTRSHIRTKYAHYLEFLKSRMFKDILGFPDCVILFTTISHARMQTMANLWNEVTVNNRALRDNIAFKVFKDEPTGWAIREPWRLCDGTQLQLDQP